MGKTVRLFGVTLLLTVLAHGASAQSNPEVLPQVVVSPTTVLTPADQLGSSFTVITAEDIQARQLRTVSDALNAVPGLNVVQTGGVGGQTAVFIRGTNSSHVKVLIDGIDVSDPSVTNGAFDFAHLMTGDIERIEILRGPQSGLYGSDAIGGVISITTKKGEGPPKATGMVEAGSFGTFNQTVGLSGSQNNINYAFNILHTQSTSVPVTPPRTLLPGEQRNNDSYDNWTYSTKLGADVSDTVTVNLVGRYTDARHSLTGDDCSMFPAPCFPELVQSSQANRNLYTRGEVVWSLFDDKLKNFFGVNYTNQRARFSDPNPDSGFTTPAVFPPYENLGQRIKLDWRGVANVMPGQTLVLGLEDQTDSLTTNSTGTTDPFFNFTQTTTKASVSNKAGYIELQSKFFERFFLVSNLRYDDNEAFGGHTTYRIAPSFIVPVTDTKLKGSYGTGFKAPTLYQLYANSLPYSVANPALKPEESTGYDFGFEQALLQNRVQFGVTYFSNDIKNLIAFQSDPLTFVGMDVNVGQTQIHGYESFVAFTVTNELKIRGDYTYTFVDASSLAGIQRKPAHKYSVNAAWMPTHAWELSATLVTVSSWFDLFDRSNSYSAFTPGYTVVNLAAKYKVNEKVEIFGRIDNLFNFQYEEPTGYLRPGLGIYGGVRVSNR